MTFDRPLFLLMLALAPLAYLVGRLRHRRITVEVPSLLLFERALARLGTPAATERRRRVDGRLLAEVLALSALALAAGGPRLPSLAPPRRVGLVIDDTPSMRAAGRPEEAVRAEAALRADLGPDDTVVTVRASEAPAGVADPVAWAALAVKAREVDEVVAVTDHALPEEGIETVLIRGSGRPNRGIVAAGARDGAGGPEVLVRTSAAGAEVTVRSASGEIALRGRGPEVRGRLRGPGPFIARLAGEDALAADDEVELTPPGAPLRVAVRGSAPPAPRAGTEAAEAPPALRRAIEAAGAALAEAGGPPSPVTFALAEEPGEGPPPRHLVAHESARFRYSDLAAQTVRVAPSPPPPGEAALRPLLSDDRGRLVVGFREGPEGTFVWIGTPLAFGDAATDWTGRRGFPVFVAEAIGAPAPGEWRALGLLSARETEEAGPPAGAGPGASASPRPDAAARQGARGAAIAGMMQSPRAPRGASLSAALLAVAAAAMIAAWALARERAVGGPAAGAAGAGSRSRARTGGREGGRLCAGS